MTSQLVSAQTRRLLAAICLTFFSMSASADYIAVTWDDNGSVSDHLWSSADGYTFAFEEFSDDLRIDVELDGDRLLRIEAVPGLFIPLITLPGLYSIINFDGDDPSLIDHSTFQTSSLTDYFRIISISANSIEFDFQITENSDLLSGSGCIGVSCGNAPVPVPAAVWLFGSGLGLLGWMRRKSMS